MSTYLDVNVLVALFAVDALSGRAEKALRTLNDDVVISDLCAAEFSSVIARRVRTRDLTAADARAAFSNFDDWCARYSQTIEIDRADMGSALRLIRRLDIPLRTPDSLHIAMVQRSGCRLLTFDRMLASAARALGMETVKA